MRPTGTITVSLAAVLAAATLATPATARPIDFAVPPTDAATWTAPNHSSPDAQDAPCTSGLAETPRAHRDDVKRQLHETTVALYGSRQ